MGSDDSDPLSRSLSSLEEGHTLRRMASAIEKVLFGAGLGLTGIAAVYLYKERKREEREREGSKVNVDVPQSKARAFPFTKMPRSDIKLEDNKIEQEFQQEDSKQSPEEGAKKGKDNQASKEGEDDSGNAKPKPSLTEDAKTALHKTKDALLGDQEEKKEEEPGLFSWFMGRQKAEEQGAEEKKNE